MHTLTTLLLAALMSSTPTTPTGQPGPMQPSDYTPAAPSRVVSWQVKRVLPPSPLYVSVDDQLVVGAASSQSSEVVTVNYRLLRAADGVIVPGQFTVAPTNTRVIKAQSEVLAEGFLLSVSVKAAVAITRGQTFVRAFLGSGPFGAGQPSYMLMADYVTTAMAPAFPNGRQLAPSEGPGWLHSVLLANPGAGFPVTFTVPSGARVELRSGNGTFTTDGTAGNRVVESFVTVGGNVAWRSTAVAVQTPSTTVRYSVAALDMVAPLDATLNFLPIPPTLTLLASDLITLTSTGTGAGDTWTNVALAMEEWLDNV